MYGFIFRLLTDKQEYIIAFLLILLVISLFTPEIIKDFILSVNKVFPDPFKKYFNQTMFFKFLKLLYTIQILSLFYYWISAFGRYMFLLTLGQHELMKKISGSVSIFSIMSIMILQIFINLNLLSGDIIEIYQKYFSHPLFYFFGFINVALILIIAFSFVYPGKR